MRFEGTDTYVATEDLMVAVNAAITLERPLLIKGEPGTGKTVLAHEVAKALSTPLLEWHIKSTTKAQHGLYEYDAVQRLRDSQLGDEKVHDKIGSASCRERVCQYVYISVVAVSLKKKTIQRDTTHPEELHNRTRKIP